MTFPSSLRALNHRDFRLFVSGQMISLIGTWMQMVAQTWLIYRLTGSAAALGMITFIGQIPMLVFAPVGGLLADHIPTRRLLLATQTIAMFLALFLGLLTLSHHVQLWHVIASAFLLGTVNAADNPGRQVFAAEAVPKEDLMNAIALNSSMVNCARVLGPAVAGLLVAMVGEGWCFVLNSISYIAVIAALMKMVKRPKPRPQGASASPLKRMAEGFSFASHCLPIRRLLLLLGLCSLLGTFYSVLMPIFADRILSGGPSALGWLMCVSGVGALAGAVSLTLRKSYHGLWHWIAASSLLFGISLLAFAFSRSLLLSALLLMPVGYAFMVQMSSTNTLLQMMVPDAFRGRVMSLHMVMFLGMVPLGGLLVSLLARLHFNEPAIVAVSGLGSLLGGIAFLVGLPRWKREASALEARRASAN
jgi:MFS family permease